MGNVLAVFFLCLGLGFVFWGLFGLLLLPAFGAGTVTVYFAGADAGSLEQTVRSYGWLRDSKHNGGVLLVVDSALPAEGLFILKKLQATRFWLKSCSADALAQTLRELEDTI